MTTPAEIEARVRRIRAAAERRELAGRHRVWIWRAEAHVHPDGRPVAAGGGTLIAPHAVTRDEALASLPSRGELVELRPVG